MVSQPQPSRFGTRLRERRRLRGLSQSELGGGRYSGSYISHLESGRRTAGPEVVAFLAERLGVSPAELGVSLPNGLHDDAQAGAETLAQLLVAERAWHDGDWTVASDLAAQAADRALDEGQAIRHWEARYLQAQAWLGGGRFEEAARLARGLADDPVAAGSPALRAQALSLASAGYRSCDQLGMAIACAAQAVDVAGQAPAVFLAEGLKSLVSAMLDVAGQSDPTIEMLCRQLQELATQVASDHARGTIFWALGTAAYKGGDPASGRRLHEQALGLISPYRDLRMWVRLRRVVATCRMETGETDGVAELLKTAREGATLVANAYDRFELSHAEATFARLNGRPDEALDIIARTLADPTLADAVATNGRVEQLHGAVLADLGRRPEARNAFMRAADVYERQTQFRLANACWKRALELAGPAGG